MASPQIRNQGTIGGNVSQDTRCWYYRGGWNCYRAGGNICYADTPTAINREHAIFDADRCVAVNPSDTAPALVALDAQMVIRGPKRRAGRQRRGLLDRPRHRHHADERAAAERAARPRSASRRRWPARSSTSRRCAIARCGTSRSSTSRRRSSPTAATSARSRLVVNAVAATPRRLKNVEARDRRQAAQRRNGEDGRRHGGQGAQTLRHNGYKVPLMRNLVKRAIRGEQGRRRLKKPSASYARPSSRLGRGTDVNLPRDD